MHPLREGTPSGWVRKQERRICVSVRAGVARITVSRRAWRAARQD